MSKDKHISRVDEMKHRIGNGEFCIKECDIIYVEISRYIEVVETQSKIIEELKDKLSDEKTMNIIYKARIDRLEKQIETYFNLCGVSSKDIIEKLTTRIEELETEIEEMK